MTTELELRLNRALNGQKLTFWFDIDGTLTFTRGNIYKHAVPKRPMISLINNLYSKGHTIYLFTGRGGTSHVDYRKITEEQLRQWGVQYHKLFMGHAKDIIVDDCSIQPEELLEVFNVKL